MDAETRQLRQRLSDAGQVPDIVILKQITTSTNDDVRELAQKNIASILICSETQTQGRGQHQRQWMSPQGNIYLSALVNSSTPIDGRLALEVALNILQMPKLQGLNLQVKWPNDLYSPHGKWGGILVEPLSPHQAIVGVGVNLFTPELDDALQPISSLTDFGLNHLNRIDIIAQLYLAIQQAAQWFEHGCYHLTERFNHHAAFMHEFVQFEHYQGLLTGRFEGINQDGAVLLSTDGQQQAFYQGRMRRLALSQDLHQ